MTLRAKLDEDLKAAMRAGNQVARDTLRMVLAALKLEDLRLGRAPEDAEVLDVLAKAVKTRHESIAQFEQGGRADLAAKERAEIAVLQAYLPRPLSEADARQAIQALAKELSLGSKRELGQLMKAAMARFKGQIDGKLVQKIAGEILS
jgi:uncharacterized protein YqeY